MTMTEKEHEEVRRQIEQAASIGVEKGILAAAKMIRSCLEHDCRYPLETIAWMLEQSVIDSRPVNENLS